MRVRSPPSSLRQIVEERLGSDRLTDGLGDEQGVEMGALRQHGVRQATISAQILDLVWEDEVGRDRVGVFLDGTSHLLADGNHGHTAGEARHSSDESLSAAADVLAKGVLELLIQVPERPLIPLLELDKDGTGGGNGISIAGKGIGQQSEASLVELGVGVGAENTVEAGEALALGEQGKHLGPNVLAKELAVQGHVLAGKVEDVVGQDQRVLLAAVLGLLDEDDGTRMDPPGRDTERPGLGFEIVVGAVVLEDHTLHLGTKLLRLSIHDDTHDLLVLPNIVVAEGVDALEDLLLAFVVRRDQGQDPLGCGLLGRSLDGSIDGADDEAEEIDEDADDVLGLEEDDEGEQHAMGVAEDGGHGETYVDGDDEEDVHCTLGCHLPNRELLPEVHRVAQNGPPILGREARRVGRVLGTGAGRNR